MNPQTPGLQLKLRQGERRAGHSGHSPHHQPHPRPATTRAWTQLPGQLTSSSSNTPLRAWAGKGQGRRTGNPTEAPGAGSQRPAPCSPDIFVDLQQHLVVLEVRVPSAVGVRVEWLSGKMSCSVLGRLEAQGQIPVWGPEQCLRTSLPSRDAAVAETACELAGGQHRPRAASQSTITLHTRKPSPIVRSEYFPAQQGLCLSCL